MEILEQKKEELTNLVKPRKQSAAIILLGILHRMVDNHDDNVDKIIKQLREVPTDKELFEMGYKERD